jgi:hypothetical protein
MDGNQRYVAGQLQSLNEDLSLLKAKTILRGTKQRRLAWTSCVCSVSKLIYQIATIATDPDRRCCGFFLEGSSADLRWERAITPIYVPPGGDPESMAATFRPPRSVRRGGHLPRRRSGDQERRRRPAKGGKQVAAALGTSALTASRKEHGAATRAVSQVGVAIIAHRRDATAARYIRGRPSQRAELKKE